MGIGAEKDDDEHKFDATLPNSAGRTVADFYRAHSVADRRIHVLGLGNLGCFVAHALRGLSNPPPVTLIFHSWTLMNRWKTSAQKLQLITEGEAEKHGGFDVELALVRRRSHGQELEARIPGEPIYGEQKVREIAPTLPEGESREPISSLILCTKTPYVLQALSSVKHRLHRESVVLFLQDGMGTVEEVNKEIFPDPETRPRYMIGVNTHALRRIPDDLFTTERASFGAMSLGLLPHDRDREPAPHAPKPKFSPGSSSPVEPKYPAEQHMDTPKALSSTFRWTPNDRYLLRTLLRTPVLCATAYSPPDLLQIRLEKLAVNSVIGPLTVLMDSRNGGILYNFSLTRNMRLLLSEISLVIRSLPELAYIPNISQRFDPGRLETLVVGTANKTCDSISVMLSDVRSGDRTEIDYLNLWIVNKGEEMGIRCLTNYMMAQLVKGKGQMIQMEMGDDVPLLEEKPSESGIEVKKEVVAQALDSSVGSEV